MTRSWSPRLDAEVEPASLVALRAGAEALLPEVEIADLPLEVHGWTGLLDEYTHISGTEGPARYTCRSRYQHYWSPNRATWA